MEVKRLAHLSDLHVGKSHRLDDALVELVSALLAAGVDYLICSGDLTDHGTREEWARFSEYLSPFSGRMTLVPGNHDRLGDDLRDVIMPGHRVQVEHLEGLSLIRVDSTGLHNRSRLQGHGQLEPEDIDAVEVALADAPNDALRIVTLHHHPLPLSEDHLVERLSSHLRLPFTEELELGWELIEAINGQCDLILHGHRHHASARSVGTGSRPTWIFNAGSSSTAG
ncbi:MAG: metallophosphoesterase, partial [Myxococcota bacterium]